MLRVHEIFESVQGEGSKQGQKMTFIRLYGCNRNCAYCDQPQGDFVDMAEEQILERCTLGQVCITGGEPLMQDIYFLSELLDQSGKYISIETNGDFNTLVKKGYDSHGMRMFRRTVYNHLACSPKVNSPDKLTIQANLIDDLKILVDTSTKPYDLRPWEEFGQNYNITLWLQPKNDKLEINWPNMKHTIRLVQELPLWNLSPQLHKLIGVK